MKKLMLLALLTCTGVTQHTYSTSSAADAIVEIAFLTRLGSKIANIPFSIICWKKANIALTDVEESLDTIDKNSDEKKILESIKNTLNAGKTLVKLYFLGNL